MRGSLIPLLIAEYKSKHEGAVPPPLELLHLPWVAQYLALMCPAVAEEDDEEAWLAVEAETCPCA
jgi:hypothetical protein